MEEVLVESPGSHILGQIFMPVPSDKDADNLQVVLSMQGPFMFTSLGNFHDKS